MNVYLLFSSHRVHFHASRTQSGTGSIIDIMGVVCSKHYHCNSGRDLQDLFLCKKRKIDVVSFDYQMVVKTKVLLPSKMRILISPTHSLLVQVAT